MYIYIHTLIICVYIYTYLLNSYKQPPVRVLLPTWIQTGSICKSNHINHHVLGLTSQWGCCELIVIHPGIIQQSFEQLIVSVKDIDAPKNMCSMLRELIPISSQLKKGMFITGIQWWNPCVHRFPMDDETRLLLVKSPPFSSFSLVTSANCEEKQKKRVCPKTSTSLVVTLW